MVSVQQKPVFRDLTADDPDPEVTEIESLCMNCHANGTTRLLLTRIPYYKNVVLMSFSCEKCGYENNEIQPGGAFAEMGVRWKLRVCEQVDLNRQVVKSDYTAVRIPELDFEIPAQSQKGEVTTVEGIIARAIAGLTQDQETRRAEHPAAAEQIEQFVERLQRLRSLEEQWTLELEDISGNTFVENPEAPHRDPRCARTDFQRTLEQNHTLGIFTHDEVSDTAEAAPAAGSYEQMAADEVMQFRTNCPECNAPADTNMKVTKIPHFKEVVIMATICDACGHRTNEVKSGSGVEPLGVRYHVRVAGREDFSRDILKSETCSMSIPELELEVGGRALGGRFTTAEGILEATRGQLRDCPGAVGDAPGANQGRLDHISIPELELEVGGRALGGRFTTAEGILEATRGQLRDCPGAVGDAPGANQGRLDRFIEKLNEVLEGKRAVTIVLDDPAGNSYVQSLNDEDPEKPDDGLKIERYERSYEQNDELGLNDMKTEGYEES